jgi:hypothetical protein
MLQARDQKSVIENFVFILSNRDIFLFFLFSETAESKVPTNFLLFRPFKPPRLPCLHSQPCVDPFIAGFDAVLYPR